MHGLLCYDCPQYDPKSGCNRTTTCSRDSVSKHIHSCRQYDHLPGCKHNTTCSRDSVSKHTSMTVTSMILCQTITMLLPVPEIAQVNTSMTVSSRIICQTITMLLPAPEIL